MVGPDRKWMKKKNNHGVINWGHIVPSLSSATSGASVTTFGSGLWRFCFRNDFDWHKSQRVLFPAHSFIYIVYSSFNCLHGWRVVRHCIHKALPKIITNITDFMESMVPVNPHIFIFFFFTNNVFEIDWIISRRAIWVKYNVATRYIHYRNTDIALPTGCRLNLDNWSWWANESK